jgi:hypothetical protein
VLNTGRKVPMARIIVHDGKTKVVVKMQYAIDRDHLIFAILEDGISQGIRPKEQATVP